jgi:hypothetical protein
MDFLDAASIRGIERRVFRLACSQHLYCICRCKPREIIVVLLRSVKYPFSIETACPLPLVLN